MKQIHIDGVIGWDVLTTDLRAEFDAAKGEDIDLTISSPGGSVYEGLAIYNVIRDYRKDGGKVNARVIGMAASMASYIPLAADSVTVEDNAIWMIHNPWSFAIGNQHDMRKQADILDGIASVIAAAYVKKTGKEKVELLKMMDDETYLFGQEIVDSGFADSIEPAGDGAEDKESAMASALVSMEALKNQMEQEPERQQMDKAAAMITEMKGAVSTPKPVVNRDKPAATAETTKEEVKNMNLDQLKMEHPDVFAEAVEIGETNERERRNVLNAQAAVAPENADLQAIVSEAIEQGTKDDDRVLQNKITLALVNGKALAGENAQSIETTPDVPALSAEDQEAAELAGMSHDEYRKFMKEAE